MKILQIIDTLNIGGAEKMLVLLANLLKRKSHDVCVLTLLNPGPLAKQLDPLIPVITLNRKWKFNPVRMYKFVQIARSFDIIHVHSSHNLRYVFLASQLFRLKKVIFFHEHHGKVEVDLSVNRHQRIIYPRVHVIGVSRSICSWAHEKVQVPLHQVHLLPNTVSALIGCKPRNNTDPSKDYYSVIITANILPNKNIDFALELIQKMEKVNLTIIGRIANLAHYHFLLAKIKAFDIGNRVEFIHDCTEIQAILNQFDLAIHCSKFESGPLVLLEYLAQGLPFLSYRTGEIAYQLEERFPKFFISNFHMEFWVERINHLLTLDRQQVALEMRKYFEESFSEDCYYEQCLKIYQQGLTS